MTEPLPPLDPTFMDEALELARRHRPSPNPRVGAVVVRDGRVIGRGCHEAPGMPHAEVVALGEAGEAARGADMYVTLEPCCHHGRTGPCCEAIAGQGIRRVAVGLRDPDGRVDGRGVAALVARGITCEVGVRGAQCHRLLEAYVTHRRLGRSHVLLKAAITLDGAIATRTGDSRWISNEAALAYAHRLRAAVDAVIVGVGTVVADDPLLTVRLAEGHQPLRVVMDSRLSLPRGAKLLESAADGPVLLAHTAAAPAAARAELGRRPGVELLECAADAHGHVAPGDLARRLGERGMLACLVEGGSHVHGAFIRARVADRAALVIAPKLLGEGVPWTRFAGIDRMADALVLEDFAHCPVDDNLVVEARFPWAVRYTADPDPQPTPSS